MTSPHPRSRAAALLAVVATAALGVTTGCNPVPPTTSPDGAWRAFRAAVESNDRTAAWELLCDQDREALEARANTAGSSVKPLDVLSLDRRRLPPWEAVEVRVDGNSADVLIKLPDATIDNRKALRQRDGWRVVLGVTPP